MGVAKMSWKHEEHCTTHYGEEAQPVWTYLQDGRQATGEGCGVWDHGEMDKERKRSGWITSKNGVRWTYTLSRMAQDRAQWKGRVRWALDNNGCEPM